jgi:hypothetical protein
MSSSLNRPFSINGVLSTDKTVLQNLNDLCTAASAWLTYDISTGKWSVIINKAGTSIASFNDSNIIGNINVSDRGLNELYNAVSVEFPHVDLRDENDYVDLEIDPLVLYPNEVKNTLNIQISCLNNPVQAALIGSIELKQSRVAKIIEFRTDFSKLGLKAGDLIDVTSSMYGYTGKVFRIIKLQEDDSEGLEISITALEYDADVYSTAGLVRKERTKRTGIILASQNEQIQLSNDIDAGAQLTRLLAANLGVGLLRSLFNRIFANGQPTGAIGPEQKAAQEIDKLLGAAKKPALATISGTSSVCRPGTVTFAVGHSCTSCLFNIPDFDYDYSIDGVFEEDISIPLTGVVTVSGGSGTLSFEVLENEEVTGTQTMSVTIGGLNRTVQIGTSLGFTYSTTASPTSITEGGSSTVTLTTTGVANGTSVPYAITGTGTGRVTTALTGSVTVNDGSATLAINTTDDGVFTGTQSVTVTFNSAQADLCGELDKTAAISILDNETAPPANTTCQYISVPMVWCGTFNGSDNQLTSMSVLKSVSLPVPQAGEATIAVPTAVSVTKGNPSTIAVTATTNVAAAALAVGGVDVNIITSFNSVGPKGLITGSTVTLKGYF